MRGGVLARLGFGRRLHRVEFTRLDLVGLGEHEAIAHRRGVEHLQHVAIDILDPVAAVDQHQRALQYRAPAQIIVRSEEHTSELQSLMRTSYAVFCLKKKKKTYHIYTPQ